MQATAFLFLLRQLRDLLRLWFVLVKAVFPVLEDVLFLDDLSDTPGFRGVGVDVLLFRICRDDHSEPQT